LHIVVIIAVIVTGIVKYYIKDENGDGIVDDFQKKKPNG
jgi:hypothetical protein